MDEGCAPICFRCASENDSSTYCVRAMKDGVGGDLIYIYRPPFSKKWKRSIHIDCTKAAEISWKPITETVVDIIYFFEEFPEEPPITTPYMFHRCSTCYSRKLCDECYLQSSSCGNHHRQQPKNKNWAKYVISREFR